MSPQALSLSEIKRVLILGLLPGQAAKIKSEFPSLDIRCGLGSRSNAQSYAEAVAHSDAVLVMTKFIGHSLTDGLDKAKTVLIRGGLSRLRNYLEQLTPRAREEKPAAVPIVRLWESVNFAPLFGATDRETVSIIRPERMPAHAFVKEIDDAVSKFFRRGGFLTFEIAGGRCDFRIVKAPTKSHTPILDLGEKLLLENESARLAVPLEWRAQAEEFWRQAFIVAANTLPGAMPGEWAECADSAVKSFLSFIAE